MFWKTMYIDRPVSNTQVDASDLYEWSVTDWLTLLEAHGISILSGWIMRESPAGL